MTSVNYSSSPDAGHPTVKGISLPELETTTIMPDNELLLEAIHPLHNVRTRVTVNVGEVSVTVGELLSAQQGQVLKLASLVQDDVDLLVEGKVIARGQLVAVDNYFAVRITQLPTPLELRRKSSGS